MAGFVMLKKTLTLLFFTMALSSFSLNLRAYDLPILSGVGGDFTAVDNHGETIGFSDYAGNVAIIAFGYTNCADICPFTLGYLKQLYQKLTEDEQKKVRFIFVTIDPEYDTPAHLNDFLGHFNKDFIGISGTQEQTDYIVSLYQAQYNQLSSLGMMPTHNIRRVNTKLFAEDEIQVDEASLFSHSVSLYLIDKDGFTRSIEYTGTPKDEFLDKIKQLLNE